MSNPSASGKSPLKIGFLQAAGVFSYISLVGLFFWQGNNFLPNVNNYIIELPNEFKNIYSVELIQAIIPAKNNADEEPYLLLNIGEISDVVLSNDKNISDSFAILQPNTPIKPAGFMQIDKRIHENTVKYYKTPKANLSRMTIKILDSLGDVFNFGTDTIPPNAIDKTLQNTFIFKIVTLEKRRKELNHRNVF